MYNKGIAISIANYLVNKYNYKPLPTDISSIAKDVYKICLPKLNSNKPLFTINNIRIANKFDNIIIGDYGAYIEINKNDIYKDNIILKPGQEFRKEHWFSGKYIWYTDKLNKCKLYYQLRTVKYADYKVCFFYVSPYEVKQI